MLIVGSNGSPPEQRGMPFPRIRYALAVPIQRQRDGVILHALPCSCVPIPMDAAAHGLRQVIWSTTYDEIEEYASREFGEEGWSCCPKCGGPE